MNSEVGKQINPNINFEKVKKELRKNKVIIIVVKLNVNLHEVKILVRLVILLIKQVDEVIIVQG